MDGFLSFFLFQCLCIRSMIDFTCTYYLYLLVLQHACFHIHGHRFIFEAWPPVTRLRVLFTYKGPLSSFIVIVNIRVT